MRSGGLRAIGEDVGRLEAERKLRRCRLARGPGRPGIEVDAQEIDLDPPARRPPGDRAERIAVAAADVEDPDRPARRQMLRAAEALQEGERRPVAERQPIHRRKIGKAGAEVLEGDRLLVHPFRFAGAPVRLEDRHRVTRSR